MKNHLIIGGSGLVGENLAKSLLLFNSDIKVSKTSFSSQYNCDYTLDISKSNDVRYVIDTCCPDVIWLPAALTDVALCERDQSLSYKYNVIGPENIFKASGKIPVIFYSTDYVFDGDDKKTRRSKTDPKTIYGKHKLISEQRALNYSKFIIRTSSVFGYGGNNSNFGMSVINSIKNNESLSIIKNQIDTPTYVRDLTNKSVELYFKNSLFSINHISGNNPIAREDFARILSKYYKKEYNLKINYINGSDIKRPNGGLSSDHIFNFDTSINSFLKEINETSF